MIGEKKASYFLKKYFTLPNYVINMAPAFLISASQQTWLRKTHVLAVMYINYSLSQIQQFT